MKNNIEKAYFAGGCFWGVEYFFEKTKGVLSTKVGYMGGETEKPTYEEVSNKTTGHAETVEITFDNTKVTFEELAKLFFEIHDPTQIDGQGPDIGNQYRSVIFYTNENQKIVAEKLIDILIKKKYKIVTKIVKAENFWEGEEYHQKYYTKKNSKPYCHAYIKKF